MDSCSTYGHECQRVACGEKAQDTYCDLEIHHLVGICRHLIAETEPVFPLGLRREDKIPLPFLLSLHDFLVIGAYHMVVDIEGPARLDLLKSDMSWKIWSIDVVDEQRSKRRSLPAQSQCW